MQQVEAGLTEKKCSHQHVSSVRMVDGSRMRTLYAELLLTYPRALVRNWLSEWAVAHDSQAETLLAKLWDASFQFPLECEHGFYKHLEKWLIAQGDSPAVFAQKCFRRFAEQPALSAQRALRAYKPYMALFYSAHDQRQLLLKLLSPMYDAGLTDLRLVSQSIKYGRRSDLALFLPRTGTDVYSAFNYGLWALPELKYAPVVLGLPAFEETRLRMDMRDPNQILAWNGWKGAKPLGKVMSITAFLQENGTDIVLNELPHANGTVFAQDVCAPNGQVLLQAGCLYGVPCAMVEFRYATALGKIANPFERLVSQLVEPEYSLWTQIRERHELLLQELSAVLDVVYHHSDDSITVGDQHLMRNVPAKILRNVLREFIEKGRSDFENREFKRDSEICMDPLNPNFEGRLNRVIEHLDRLPGGNLQIQKIGRGRFRFSVNNQLKFREEP